MLLIDYKFFIVSISRNKAISIYYIKLPNFFDLNVNGILHFMLQC